MKTFADSITTRRRFLQSLAASPLVFVGDIGIVNAGTSKSIILIDADQSSVVNATFASADAGNFGGGGSPTLQLTFTSSLLDPRLFVIDNGILKAIDGPTGSLLDQRTVDPAPGNRHILRFLVTE